MKTLQDKKNNVILFLI